MQMKKIKNQSLQAAFTVLVSISYMLIKVFADKNYVTDFEHAAPYHGHFFLKLLENNSLACSMTTVGSLWVQY